MDNNLNEQLWKIANDLRGQMDSSEFKNYMLGLIFYKSLSDKFEVRAADELDYEGIEIKYSEMDETHEFYEDLMDELTDVLGYTIKPEHLFSNIIRKIKMNEAIITLLSEALVSLERSASGSDSEQDIEGLFGDVDLSNNRLGATGTEKNRMISQILTKINDIEGLTDNQDNLGNAYEYLLKQFASSAGKKGGEFYTPSEVSDIVARIAINNREEVYSIYDPTCGSGSLLLKAAKQTKYSYIKGQELNVTTFNLARMNMFLHDVRYSKFDIRQGNTLLSDKFNDEKFDAIVANPPFGVKWDADQIELNDDKRFTRYGKLAPKSKGEFAFIQHMVSHLKEDGVMATVVPHGVLFRGAAEGTIRKYMLEEENVIDAVIGLPANLFFGTGIPACIIVFKKCRKNDESVLFIDASKDFEKIKTQNVLREEDIEKITSTYFERKEIEKYSRNVKFEEIKENDFNLNIPRYVDTFEEEEPIDIKQVSKEYQELVEEEKQIRADLLSQLDELNGDEDVLAAIKAMIEVR